MQLPRRLVFGALEKPPLMFTIEIWLTAIRCRGWCVRSECARDKAPRLLLCIVLLIELVRIDLGHVSARMSCLPTSVLI